jgi:hypothetical protein
LSYGKAKSELLACSFTSYKADTYGGGFDLQLTDGTTLIDECAFVSCKAPIIGAVYLPDFQSGDDPIEKIQYCFFHKNNANATVTAHDIYLENTFSPKFKETHILSSYSTNTGVRVYLDGIGYGDKSSWLYTSPTQMYIAGDGRDTARRH